MDNFTSAVEFVIAGGRFREEHDELIVEYWSSITGVFTRGRSSDKGDACGGALGWEEGDAAYSGESEGAIAEEM
jgi:hypothetical protein